MAKLLYTATAPGGKRTEGFIEAPSVQSAREQLERQGLTEIVVHQEPATALDEAELSGLSVRQQRDLARFKLRLMRSPTLATLLAEQARRSVWWLVADAALVAYGVAKADVKWIFAGLLAAAVPFGMTAFNYRHAERYHRLLSQFAVGNWDAVRVLADELREVSRRKPLIAFDLDLRLAGIHAREHALAEALQRVEAWRPRWAGQPGFFEMRLASVHHMAGDTAGFVELMAKAHELSPGDPSRRVDHALAQARFGSVERAESLLEGLDASALPAHAQGFVQWARGLVLLRSGRDGAEPALEQAVACFLQLTDQPAVWPALALCACDHALAMHRAGRHDEARARIAQVWPILEVHATVPLLRMLEADQLLPPRQPTNS